MKERIYKFDNLKVICMIMVIMAHTLDNSYGCVQHEMLRFPLLCFTMPMFTFISGYFAKQNPNLRNDIRNLLLPYILFTIVYDILMSNINPNFVISWKKPGFAMWYLFILFVYRQILPYINRIPHRVLVSFALSWIVGLFPQIGTDYNLSRLFCFLPYFLMGHETKHNKELNDNIIKPLNGWGIIILLIVLIAWEILIYLHPGMTYATGFYSGYGFSLIGLICRIVLQITILVTGYLILRLCPNKETLLSMYGRRTLSVYLLHPLIVLPCAYLLFPKLHDANIIQTIAMIIVPTVLCLMLFNKYIDNILMKLFK